MRLYHFTAAEYLEGIKQNGIVRGHVATSPTEALQAPWLTSDPSWEAQRWTHSSAHDKSRFRLTVEIPDNTRGLWHWPRLARELKVSPEWFKIQSDLRGDPEPWYVFYGVIPPEWIVAIDERPGGVKPSPGEE